VATDDPLGLITLRCDGSVDQLLRRAVGRIEALGHDVLAVIDHSGEAAEAGLAIPDTKLVLFASPQAATQLMVAHPRIAIDLPLKLLISVTDDDALLSYNAADYLARRHGLSEDETDALRVVATAGLNAADVAFPIRGATRRYENCSFHHGEVTTIDHDTRVVRLADGDTIAYDYLIVGAAARAAYFDVPGAETHAFALYSLTDATRLRNRILRCIEAADAHPDLIEGGVLTFVVVGGGPTDVEMAGALFEVCQGILRKDFPQLHRHTAHVVLVEMLDTVLPALHATSQQYALKALRRRGVDVRSNEKVAGVEPDGLVLVDGERIPSSTVIWAAGVQTATLADGLGAERCRGGRVSVMGDLALSGHPEVFVIGDMANALAPDGRSLPQIAQVAIQSGEHAARQVVRRLNGEPTEPFTYTDRGTMATIGRRSAVTELPNGIRIRGTLGWLSWLFLHLLYLAGFRNRMSVLLNWAWSYVTHERGPRLIFGPDEPG
jgi:NADH:quinone reductase (non-electrogenic)